MSIKTYIGKCFIHVMVLMFLLNSLLDLKFRFLLTNNRMHHKLHLEIRWDQLLFLKVKIVKAGEGIKYKRFEVYHL